MEVRTRSFTGVNLCFSFVTYFSPGVPEVLVGVLSLGHDKFDVCYGCTVFGPSKCDVYSRYTVVKPTRKILFPETRERSQK